MSAPPHKAKTYTDYGRDQRSYVAVVCVLLINLAALRAARDPLPLRGPLPRAVLAP